MLARRCECSYAQPMNDCMYPFPFTAKERGSPVALCDSRHPSAMTSASEYSITVESCVRQGSKFVWTLLLKGFKEGEYIYIYRNSEKVTTAGHCIKNPAAPIVIDSWEADLFKDVSKQEEYHFR